MPGPAPKHPDQRARRNATVAMTQLPAEGRKGPAPKWPLGADVALDVEIELKKLGLKDIEYDIDWAGTARERTAARRRLANAKKAIATLEAKRKGAARLELEIWKSLWSTPQAQQWEKRHWYREVALYARHQAKAECGSLDDSKEARMREDRLGLNDLAMLRLRWEISDAAAAGTGPVRRSRQNSSKYRGLKVVS